MHIIFLLNLLKVFQGWCNECLTMNEPIQNLDLNILISTF